MFHNFDVDVQYLEKVSTIYQGLCLDEDYLKQAYKNRLSHSEIAISTFMVGFKDLCLPNCFSVSKCEKIRDGTNCENDV